jgi:hypothetical protein
VQDRAHLPVLSLVRRRVVRPVLLPVLTRALPLVQVPVATSLLRHRRNELLSASYPF